MSDPVILDPKGQPARKPVDKHCPRCGKDKRVASGGFGVPHPVCSNCGYEWVNEVWNG